jgi:hypothetical protein
MVVLFSSNKGKELLLELLSMRPLFLAEVVVNTVFGPKKLLVVPTVVDVVLLVGVLMLVVGNSGGGTRRYSISQPSGAQSPGVIDKNVKTIVSKDRETMVTFIGSPDCAVSVVASSSA